MVEEWNRVDRRLLFLPMGITKSKRFSAFRQSGSHLNDSRGSYGRNFLVSLAMARVYIDEIEEDGYLIISSSFSHFKNKIVF